MELLQKLVDIQVSKKLTNREFAEQLGVSHTLWTRVRNSDRPIRFEILSGALKAFPQDQELRTMVLSFLEASRDPKPTAVA